MAALDLSTRAGVPVLGSLPQGLPAFALPMIRSSDVAPVLMAGVAAALISFADTSVLSRAYAAQAGRPADPNQEMVALGAANLAAALFQGIPISASASRTPVAEAAGAKTQLAAVVGAVAVACLLMWGPDLLATLPKAALAAVVIASALSLFEIRDLRRIHRIQRWEFWLSIGCLVGVAVLGPMPGIGLAIVIAVIEFLWDGWRPHSAVLGRVDGVKGYHDIGRYPSARVVPGLVLFRWDAPLFFANAEFFRDRALEAVAASPTPARWLVVGAEPVTSVDVTAADIVEELDQTLHAAGIDLCFAEMKDPVKDKLKRFGLFRRLGEKRFFATIGEAVSSYVEAEGVKWEDWEDRRTGRIEDDSSATTLADGRNRSMRSLVVSAFAIAATLVAAGCAQAPPTPSPETVAAHVAEAQRARRQRPEAASHALQCRARDSSGPGVDRQAPGGRHRPAGAGPGPRLREPVLRRLVVGERLGDQDLAGRHPDRCAEQRRRSAAADRRGHAQGRARPGRHPLRHRHPCARRPLRRPRLSGAALPARRRHERGRLAPGRGAAGVRLRRSGAGRPDSMPRAIAG